MRSPDRLALLVLTLAATGCSDATTSRTAAVEGSCDTWTVDDAIMMWPPDHEMHRYSLDDCVTIAPTECQPSGCCGDGVVDPGEQCDDGNISPGDGCNGCLIEDGGEDQLPGPEIVQCPVGHCGDGVLDPDEECDDGNGNPFDGCDTCILVDITPDRSQPGQSSATGLSITSITSNESTDATGDGHTIGDTVVVDATTFELRAERSGNRNGRIYRVNFVDAYGEAGTCTFFVPHDFAHDSL